MIKMKEKINNNLNFNKEMSLNLKISSKNNDIFFKTNNESIDFTSSPIKNNKKVIKRNIRTNSYNSFLYNQTENIMINKNPFNSNIISVDSNSKINLKKNIFSFSSTNQNFNNSKSKKNNNNNNNKKKKNHKNIKNRTKNITAHQSTSNLGKFNINTDTNNYIISNNSSEYINDNSSQNIVLQFLHNKKKNLNQNNNSYFQHSNLLNSKDFNHLKDHNLCSDKEKDKLYFRNNNNTSKNLLFLTRQNINSKNFQENKALINKDIKKHHLNEQFLYSNKKNIDFNSRDINSNPKSKKYFTKTTKNSEDKERNKKEINRLNTNINNINNLDIFNELNFLYNKSLKKRNEKNNNEERNKSGKKDIINLKKKKYNLLEENIFNQDSLLKILYENKQIKQKNDELVKQFENMKTEFEQMKKDNNNIKEELKEKTKYLKDIKLTMDIFSQELLKLQTIYKENDSYKNSESNKNEITVNLKENINSKDKQKYIIEVNTKNKIETNKNNNNTSKTINSKNNVLINTDNQEINNFYEKKINNKSINTNICLGKKSKLEKLHQLSLNNINNLINQQNKKRGGSLEANNIQDTSKIINNETKDATEKENEILYDKWPSPLYIEKGKEKINKEISSEISKLEEENESINLTNISLAENLNINKEVYDNLLNLKKSNVGKLDFKNNIDKKNEDNKKLNLITQGIINDNFNEEFLKYYDKFSDSWRKEADKMLKKGKEKNNKKF